MSSISLGRVEIATRSAVFYMRSLIQQVVFVVLLLACLERSNRLQAKRKLIHIARIDEHSKSENVPTY